MCRFVAPVMRQAQFKPRQRNRGMVRPITTDSANRHDITREVVLTLSCNGVRRLDRK
jgi:predicted protein tyrosine phosphatase